MHRLVSTLLVIGSVAVCSGAFAQTATDTKPQAGEAALSAQDRQFMEQAYNVNKLEVELAKQAQSKGSTQAIKDFGKRLENDHQLALDQLKKIADAEKVNLPSDLPKEQQATVDAMKNLSGRAFDTSYLGHVSAGQKQATDLFDKESKDGQNAALKAYAQKEVTTLKAHQDLVNQMVNPRATP